MAGRGSRLRPHTLTTPKPLIPVGGKPIVHRLVEDICALCDENVSDIGFVIGDFGKEVEADLLQVAEKMGAKGHIFYQLEPLGTAHAVLCAEPLLQGKTVVAFADTLFTADFIIEDSSDGVLWVKQIPNPQEFGVVKLDSQGKIIDFVEKPSTFVSDLAMIGVYYFKYGEQLKTEINYLIDNKVIKSNEYQLPDALRRLTEKGTQFVPGKVTEWLDCGNKDVTLHTNERVLFHDAKKGINTMHPSAKINNSIIIEPCFIGENVVLENSQIGPYASIGKGSHVVNASVEGCIIQHNTKISSSHLKNSMVGSNCSVSNTSNELSIGDYCKIS